MTLPDITKKDFSRSPFFVPAISFQIPSKARYERLLKRNRMGAEKGKREQWGMKKAFITPLTKKQGKRLIRMFMRA
ncbi:MAG TPA: hypothetical protein DIC18_03855 [Clostridiales bacterium]|nr:hypothetical protein [Clostridiales bacterium]